MHVNEQFENILQNYCKDHTKLLLCLLTHFHSYVITTYFDFEHKKLTLLLDLRLAQCLKGFL